MDNITRAFLNTLAPDVRAFVERQMAEQFARDKRPRRDMPSSGGERAAYVRPGLPNTLRTAGISAAGAAALAAGEAPRNQTDRLLVANRVGGTAGMLISRTGDSPQSALAEPAAPRNG